MGKNKTRRPMGGKKQKHDIPSNNYEDDGNVYIVVTPEGKPVYTTKPVVKGRAEYLARNLLHGGIVKQVPRGS